MVDDGRDPFATPAGRAHTAIVGHGLIGCAMEVNDGHDFTRRAAKVGGAHGARHRPDGREHLRVFTGEAVAHESPIGHATGVDAIGAEAVFLLQMLDEGHEEAMVVGVAVADVGVPVVDVEVVFRALREYSHEPFLEGQGHPSAVGADQLGAAGVAMQDQYDGGAGRNGVRGVHEVSPGQPVMLEFELGGGQVGRKGKRGGARQKQEGGLHGQSDGGDAESTRSTPWMFNRVDFRSSAWLAATATSSRQRSV